MAFRWMLHAPVESLSQTAREQRTAFLNSNPKYKAMYDRANLIRTELLALPAKPEPRSPEGIQQGKLLEELAVISETQEAVLASYSLRREASEMVFPPQKNISEFQRSLRPDQLALVSLATSSGYHIFLLNSKAIKYAGLSDGRTVLRGVSKLLKDAGLMEAALDLKNLQDEDWKDSARDLKNKLFGDKSDANWGRR